MRTTHPLINYSATVTDQYQLAMAQVHYLQGHHASPAVFDYFFRKNPFDGGYVVFAGLGDLLEILQDFRFDDADLEYLDSEGMHPTFVEYLSDFRFTGAVHAATEGDVVFPTRPVVQVEAPLVEAQIIETVLLNVLNFQSLIATKASRMRLTAGARKLVDFGLRRAQGAGGYAASRAAYVGGFDATSHVRAGRDYGIPISGTMAHSFVQSYDDELTAFRAFAREMPANCVLLVDTYDTLASGVPNAITVAREMQHRGQRLTGIRLDSGDLAYLARASRNMLDSAGFDYVKIAASNQLDEHVIKSLLEQQAPIDLFGVGTNLVVGRPDAALDGVYKLAFAHGKPRIKLSEARTKVTLPHRKQVHRVLNKDGSFSGTDVVSLRDEDGDSLTQVYHPFEPEQSQFVAGMATEPLLHPVMVDGRPTAGPVGLATVARFAQSRLLQLPDEYKRFVNPHIYKVSLSPALRDERDRLLQMHRRDAGRTGSQPER